MKSPRNNDQHRGHENHQIVVSKITFPTKRKWFLREIVDSIYGAGSIQDEPKPSVLILG